MKTELRYINGCQRMLHIEVSPQELKAQFDQVYRDIGRRAHIPGFRPGKAPRDLLEIHYGKAAQEEVIKRSIPEYYLKSVWKENLTPVAPPEIENVQFKNHTLYFSVRVDVRPQLKLKAYKELKVIKKRINITEEQIEKTLERLRHSIAEQAKGAGGKKEIEKPHTLDEQLVRALGFARLEELKRAVEEDLKAQAEIEMRRDMHRQIAEQLLARTSLDAPPSWVNTQAQKLYQQLRMSLILQGKGKEEVQAKDEELKAEAKKEATRRVKLSFILDEIARRENIQIGEEELEQNIAEEARRLGKDKDELRKYLEQQNLIPTLRQEIREEKTMEFLLQKARIEESKEI